MDVTLGLLIFLIVILFPGLLYRKLYFYGEFSKQFSSGLNIVTLNAISIVPGLISLLVVYVFYDTLIGEIDLGEVVDKLKEVNNPSSKFTESEDIPLKDLFNQKAIPFIGLVYLVSTILGLITGRLIRITKLDTKFKLLRFKNYWFYLFKGQHTNFKKMRHLRERNKSHVFTNADILIDTGEDLSLYSGIVVDYELNSQDCGELSKVVLRNAKRYPIKDGTRGPKLIPGDLFIVDCSSMININLTYFYKDAARFIESKYPKILIQAFGVFCLLIIPLFLFRSDNIHFELYKLYFSLVWYEKVIAYFLFVQILGLFVPFRFSGNNQVTWANLKSIGLDIFLILLFLGLLVAL